MQQITWQERLDGMRNDPGRFCLLPILNGKRNAILNFTNAAEWIELNDQKNEKWKLNGIKAGLIAAMMDRREANQRPMKSWVRDPRKFAVWILIDNFFAGQEMSEEDLNQLPLLDHAKETLDGLS